MIFLFLVDWFSFSSKIDSVDTIIELLQLEKAVFVKGDFGLYHYRDSILFEGIRICYNPRDENMGVFVDMSGKGCRSFETYSACAFSLLFKYIIENEDDYNVTRLDVAFDEKEGIIPIEKLGDDTTCENFVSKFDSWDVHRSNDGGYSVTIGSNKSEVLLRIYNKAAERKVSGHWVRLELQLRRERAFNFLKQYDDNLGELWMGVINNYLRYVKPSKTDSNKRRWEVAPYWKKLIKTAEKVRLFTPATVDYNIDNLDYFVVNQMGGAVETYIKLMGVDYMQNAVEKKNSKRRLNPKYQNLLNKKELDRWDEI